MNQNKAIIGAFLAVALALLMVGATANSIFRFSEWRLSSPTAGQSVLFHDANTLTNGTPAAATKMLFQSTTSTGVGASGEEELYSTTIPANTLSANGDTILFWAAGSTSSGALDARLRVYLAGALIFDSQPFNVTANYNGAESNSWSIRGFIIRSGASGQKCIVHLAANTLGPVNFSSYNNTAGDTTAGIILKITQGYQTPNTGWMFGELFAGVEFNAP